LDGTPHSRAAADLAFRWAAGFGTAVSGLGVVDEPGVCAPAMAPIGGGAFKEHRDEVLLARAHERVDEWIEEFRRRAGDLPARAYKVVGDPRDRLVAEAQRFDLLVLGRETHFKFATQADPCDTLRQVLRDSPRPVVAVPESPTAGRSTIVAYDGSLQAARAAYAFQASGLAIAGPVHIVGVGNDPSAAGRAVEFFAGHGVVATPHLIPPAASPAAVLQGAAGRLDAGLIVMGAYGQSVLREFFLGSVTRTLLREAAVPLFLFH
jgi:nucleotide-binding universal stress UspA family protein